MKVIPPDGSVWITHFTFPRMVNGHEPGDIFMMADVRVANLPKTGEFLVSNAAGAATNRLCCGGQPVPVSRGTSRRSSRVLSGTATGAREW